MPTNIVMPQMGESIFEGTITQWLKDEGQRIDRDEDLFEISTDKVDSVIPSSVSGVLRKIICPVGAKVPINTVVAIVEEADRGAAAPPEETPPAPAPKEADDDGGKPLFSSPLVRRIARDENVDLSKVKGSGWKGRITKKDIQGYLAAGREKAPAPPPPSPAPPPAPPRPRPAGRPQVVPMTPMRVKIAEHMVASRSTSAHVTTVFEVDVSGIVALREREKRDYEVVHKTRLTFTPFFAMACVQAIRDFPVLNASVDGKSVRYHSEVNLGVAVALPEGLIVPVVRNCEEKSFLGVARAIEDVAARARAKKLAVEEVQGGTFTLTNPGVYGSLFGTPIINQPQVAILCVGTIGKRPVVIDDAIAIRSRCCLALSFDHRIIDGATADQFMARVKEILERWTIPIR